MKLRIAVLCWAALFKLRTRSLRLQKCPCLTLLQVLEQILLYKRAKIMSLLRKEEGGCVIKEERCKKTSVLTDLCFLLSSLLFCLLFGHAGHGHKWATSRSALWWGCPFAFGLCRPQAEPKSMTLSSPVAMSNDTVVRHGDVNQHCHPFCSKAHVFLKGR